MVRLDVIPSIPHQRTVKISGCNLFSNEINRNMKTLITLKSQLIFIGTLQPSTQREFIRFSIINCVFFTFGTLHMITMLWFIVFDAETFDDYSKCSFYILTAALTIAWYIILVWNRKNYANFFRNLDGIIEESKLTSCLKI